MARQFRVNNANATLRKRMAFGKLQGRIDEYEPHKREMLLLSPQECKPFLDGNPYQKGMPGPLVEAVFEHARSIVSLPRVRMPPREDTTWDSLTAVSLDVPEDQLQVVLYNKAVEERQQLTALSFAQRFMVSCPSPVETWRMEREVWDHKIAHLLLRTSIAADNSFHLSRRSFRRDTASLDVTLAERKRRLLKSGGRGSPLREVISIDEDWPQ
ncbi:hypothetical protein J3F83DRAFT_718368 [Trichoderma novae-zelandiae]